MFTFFTILFILLALYCTLNKRHITKSINTWLASSVIDELEKQVKVKDKEIDEGNFVLPLFLIACTACVSLLSDIARYIYFLVALARDIYVYPTLTIIFVNIVSSMYVLFLDKKQQDERTAALDVLQSSDYDARIMVLRSAVAQSRSLPSILQATEYLYLAYFTYMLYLIILK